MADLSKKAKFRLAAVQAAPVWLDLEKSVDKACALIHEAGDNGADFVGFPECFLSGYPSWYNFFPATSKICRDLATRLFESAVEINSKEVDRLCQAAADAHTFVIMGINERRPGTTGTLYNSQLFIDENGQLVGHHQKLVPTVGERLVHAPGSGEAQGAVKSSSGPVSGLICGENSNPMALALLATQYPLIHVANWPTGLVPDTVYPDHQLVSRNVAYICKCYVISSVGTYSQEMINVLGVTDDARRYFGDPKQLGGSVIIAPDGGIIAGPLEGNVEGILYADGTREATLRGHLIHDHGGHYGRPDVFQLKYKASNLDLVVVDEDDASMLGLSEIRAIRDEMRRKLAISLSDDSLGSDAE